VRGGGLLIPRCTPLPTMAPWIHNAADQHSTSAQAECYFAVLRFTTFTRTSNDHTRLGVQQHAPRPPRQLEVTLCTLDLQCLNQCGPFPNYRKRTTPLILQQWSAVSFVEHALLLDKALQIKWSTSPVIALPPGDTRHHADALSWALL